MAEKFDAVGRSSDGRVASEEHMPEASAAEVPSPPVGRYRRALLFTYNLVHSPEIETRLERYVRIIIATLIGINVIAIVLESVRAISDHLHPVFLAIEYISVGIFTFEYLLRLWAAPGDPRYARPVIGRIRYAFSFFALIDLLAILPFFLPALISIDLRFIRGLRLLRLMRVLKLGRYSSSLAMLARVYRSKRDDILVSLFVILLVLLLSSSLMFYLEHEAQPETFPNIPAALWWGVATLTTVGYGDIYPTTVLGKLCASVISLLGIGVVALPSSLLVAGFIEELQARKLHRTCPHCGGDL